MMFVEKTGDGRGETEDGRRETGDGRGEKQSLSQGQAPVPVRRYEVGRSQWSKKYEKRRSGYEGE